MEIYQVGRGKGKTNSLLRWLKATPNGMLLVHSEAEKKRLLDENEWLSTFQIISPGRLLDGGLRGHRQTILAIDNLDLILPTLLGATIGPVTMTPEEVLDSEGKPYWTRSDSFPMFPEPRCCGFGACDCEVI